MKRQPFIVTTVCLAITSSIFAKTEAEKEDTRLANATKVLTETIGVEHGLPTAVLNEATCVLVFPNVKQVPVGFGDSYGRGAMVCRSGPEMKGSWGAPVMYAFDPASIKMQLGSTPTDFVLLTMNEKIAEEIIKGKSRLGPDASSLVGEIGPRARPFGGHFVVLTYSRSKGLFEGAALDGSTIEPDVEANKAFYGTDVTAKEIVGGAASVSPASQPLVVLLESTSPKRTF